MGIVLNMELEDYIHMILIFIVVIENYFMHVNLSKINANVCVKAFFKAFKKSCLQRIFFIIIVLFPLFNSSFHCRFLANFEVDYTFLKIVVSKIIIKKKQIHQQQPWISIIHGNMYSFKPFFSVTHNMNRIYLIKCVFLGAFIII